jgi:hypothetical protein
MSIQTIQKVVVTDRQQDYLPHDVISINIQPQDVALLAGENSYLHFHVILEEVAGKTAFKANLDPNGGGAMSIIETVSIYDGTGATLLEQLDELPVYQGIRTYFDNTDGLNNVRNLQEGLAVDNSPYSPYFSNATVGEVGFTKVECCIPLYMSGIFYSETAFPVSATNGLIVKIKLASKLKAIKAVNANGMVVQKDRAGGVPVLNDLPYNTTHNFGAGIPIALQTLPQVFGLAVALAAAPTTNIAIWADSAPAPSFGVPVAPTNVRATVGANLTTMMNLIGQNLYYTDDAGVLKDAGAITNIAAGAVANTIDITVASFTPTVATPANFPMAFSCVQQDYEVSYRVQNMELVACCVEPSSQYFNAMMSKMKSSGGLEMDIKSFNLYRTNLFSGQVKNQNLLPLTEFRARSLLQAQIYPSYTWNQSAYLPLEDFMSSYQYQIANKNVPNVAVQTDKESHVDVNTWNVLCDAERNKCLEGSKVDVKDELHPAGHFVFGRELAKRGHSFNANKNEIRLTQDWGVADGVAGVVLPQYNKLLYSMVHHFRKLQIKSDNVVVSY